MLVNRCRNRFSQLVFFLGGVGGCLLGGTLGGGVNGLIFIVTFLFEYECNKSDFSMGMGYKVVFWTLYMYIHS